MLEPANLAFARGQTAGDELDQGRFAPAIGADQTNFLAPVNMKIEIRKKGASAKEKDKSTAESTV